MLYRILEVTSCTEKVVERMTMRMFVLVDKKRGYRKVKILNTRHTATLHDEFGAYWSIISFI